MLNLIDYKNLKMMQNSSECVTPMLYQEHFVKMRLITQGELEIQIYPSSRLLEF
jgi:hypothetical protein